MTLSWMEMMELEQFRRQFGARLKALRKKKRWTQKELAAQLGLGFGQVNKYEGGLQSPPMDKLVQLAEIFAVSLDYLLTGEQRDPGGLHDKQLLERFQALQDVEEINRETVIRLIDAVIAKERVEKAMDLFGQKVG